MRYAFIITIIVLLQLFSFGAALSLEWWLQPWSHPALHTVPWIIVFAITNILLLLTVIKLFANSYRWISAWMLVMHFMMLTALSTSLLYAGLLLLSELSSSAFYNSEILAIGLRIFALLFFIGLFIYSLYIVNPT